MSDSGVLTAMRSSLMGFATWLERSCLVDSPLDDPHPGVRLRLVPLIWTLACAELAALLGAIIAHVQSHTMLTVAAVSVAVACGRLLIGLRGMFEPRGVVVLAALLLSCASIGLVDRAGGGSGQSVLLYLPFVFWLGALYLSQAELSAVVLLSCGAVLVDIAMFGFSGLGGSGALAIALALGVPTLVASRIAHARTLLIDSKERIRVDTDRADALDTRESERFEDFVALSDSWYFETGVDLKLTFVSPDLRQRLGDTQGAIRNHTLVDLIRRNHPSANGLYEIAHAMDYELAIRGRHLIWFGADRRAVALRVHAWPAYSADGAFRGYRGKASEVPFETLGTRLGSARKGASPRSAQNREVAEAVR